MLADVEVSEDLTEASVKLPAFTSKDLNRKRMCFQSYLFFHQQIVCQTFKIRGEAFWKSRFCKPLAIFVYILSAYKMHTFSHPRTTHNPQHTLGSAIV